jgi:hypothetical protein
MSREIHPEARKEYRETVIFYGKVAKSFVAAVDLAALPDFRLG